jgi:hypothetical protein
MIVSYAAPGGRRVLLADANPAIGGLRVATLTALNEISAVDAADAGTLAGAGNPADGVGGRPYAAPDQALRPNLGPPPSRPDWRRGTRS